MSKISIRIISILEIIGGLSGIGFVVWEIVAAPSGHHPVVIGAIVLTIYVFSFIAGVALWLERPFGRFASILVQAIQLPKIYLPARYLHVQLWTRRLCLWNVNP
jgi:hypothetical protein